MDYDRAYKLSNSIRGTAPHEQAYLEFIDGQNDAIDGEMCFRLGSLQNRHVELLSPQSDSYYYLQGWHDAKRRLASGELCWMYEQEQQQCHEDLQDWDWEVF